MRGGGEQKEMIGKDSRAEETGGRPRLLTSSSDPAMVGVRVRTEEPGIPSSAERRGYSTTSVSSFAAPAPPALSRKWSFFGSGCGEPKLCAPGSGPAAVARPARAVLAPAGALRLRLRPGPGVAMTSELDIFVGNTTLIDEDVYRLWLDGYSGLWGAAWWCPAGRAVVLDGEGAGPGPGLLLGKKAEGVRDVWRWRLESLEGL